MNKQKHTKETNKRENSTQKREKSRKKREIKTRGVAVWACGGRGVGTGRGGRIDVPSEDEAWRRRGRKVAVVK